MKLAFAVLATLGLLSFPAMAAEESGFYAGAGIGQANLSVDKFGIDTDLGEFSYKFDADDTALKVFGGWRFNKYIAVELDYIDLGTMSDKRKFDIGEIDPLVLTTDIGVSGWAPYVIGTWPIGMVELSAKLGYVFYDVDVDLKGKIGGESLGPKESESDSDEDLAYGVGIGMTFFEHLNAKLEYEVIDVSDADIDAFWLTGAWRF